MPLVFLLPHPHGLKRTAVDCRKTLKPPGAAGAARRPPPLQTGAPSGGGGAAAKPPLSPAAKAALKVAKQAAAAEMQAPSLRQSTKQKTEQAEQERVFAEEVGNGNAPLLMFPWNFARQMTSGARPIVCRDWEVISDENENQISEKQYCFSQVRNKTLLCRTAQLNLSAAVGPPPPPPGQTIASRLPRLVPPSPLMRHRERGAGQQRCLLSQDDPKQFYSLPLLPIGDLQKASCCKQCKSTAVGCAGASQEEAACWPAAARAQPRRAACGGGPN